MAEVIVLNKPTWIEGTPFPKDEPVSVPSSVADELEAMGRLTSRNAKPVENPKETKKKKEPKKSRAKLLKKKKPGKK